jgi:DNA-binding transcriptional LysR family regulator
MRFTLKQLEYFVAAGETGSITLASERVHISQPSISAAITQIEQEFGFQLFLRHHAQGLSLTPQGAHFLREAKNLLLQAEELNATASALSGRIAGPLTIGCPVTLYPLIVPELIQAFRSRFEEVRIEAVAGNRTELFAGLRRGDIAMALGYDMGVAPDILFEPLADLPPFIFVAAGHPLAGHGTVPLKAMAEEPFLLLDLPFSRDYFLSLFHQQELQPRIIGGFEHMDTIRGLVARGNGFGISNIRPRNTASLDGLPLAYLTMHGPARPLSLGLASLKGMRRTRTADAFATLCRELVDDGRIPGTI